MLLSKMLALEMAWRHAGRKVAGSASPMGPSVKVWFAFPAILLSCPGAAAAGGERIGEDWSATLFSGPLSTDSTTNEILVGSIDFKDSVIVGAAISKGLARVGKPLSFEVEFQTVKHFGRQAHWEMNGLVIARWSEFPWNHVIDTTIAIGDGLSYPTEVPPLERERHGAEHSKRLLNYVLGEVTFSLPDEKHWGLVWRFHHRSGAFGLFDDVTEGSTVIAGGIKYRF